MTIVCCDRWSEHGGQGVAVVGGQDVAVVDATDVDISKSLVDEISVIQLMWESSITKNTANKTISIRD